MIIILSYNDNHIIIWGSSYCHIMIIILSYEDDHIIQALPCCAPYMRRVPIQRDNHGMWNALDMSVYNARSDRPGREWSPDGIRIYSVPFPERITLIVEWWWWWGHSCIFVNAHPPARVHVKPSTVVTYLPFYVNKQVSSCPKYMFVAHITPPPRLLFTENQIKLIPPRPSAEHIHYLSDNCPPTQPPTSPL